MSALYTKLLIQKNTPKIIKQVTKNNKPPKKVDWTIPKKFRNRFKKTWVDKYPQPSK